MLRSIARNLSTTASVVTLSQDTYGSNPGISENTAAEYLDALERIMIVEDLPAWSPDVRSRTRVRKAAKRHFVDPSLATAAMRMTPRRLLGDLRYLGFLFESLVVRDLRVYAQRNDAEVYHYRDETLEADAVVEHADGRWSALEVKLGVGMIDEAATNLLKVADRIDPANRQTLGVIVASGYGYKREDGVQVIPIGALGP